MLSQLINDYQSSPLNNVERKMINHVIEKYGASDIKFMQEMLPLQKKSSIVKYVQKEYVNVKLEKKKKIHLSLLPLNCEKLQDLIAWVCLHFFFVFMQMF